MISITVLVENTARGSRILGEHGFACWVETPTHRVLFDTGQGLTLVHNSAVQQIDLAQADAIVLSHGHYDHVGGLEATLPRARHASLFLHPRATEAKFTGSASGVGQRISLPFVEHEEFRADGRRVVQTTQPCEVVPGVWATGEIPRTNDFEDTGGPFFLDSILSRPDPLLDDQALYLTTSDGTVVLMGCAHAGVVNTLDYITRLTGIPRIHAVIGGMHLEGASARRMSETVAALRRFGVQRLGPVHCTGLKAVAALLREFPTQFTSCAAGTTLRFGRSPASTPAVA
jgi:7,8-dihydropterin-6-yl-methyl-4-(beta-D-ribofuranosyl)aminobenzene 5'-phosphate synthase